MDFLTTPVQSLPHVLLHYLASGFGTPEVPALVSGGGMPADTLLFDAQSVILSFTCVAAPMFRAKVERLAADQSIDVMLVRRSGSAGRSGWRRTASNSIWCRLMKRSPNAPTASIALHPTWPNASTRKVRSDADEGQARSCDAKRRGQPRLPAGSGEPA
jgi:hypothetical protein